MDAQQQFWLQFAVTAFIGIIGIYYARKQVQLQKVEDKQSGVWSRFWPIVLMIVLAASSWIPYIIRPDDLPNFPDPHAPVYEYGVMEGECYVVVNGERFLRYASHYKLASGCYVYDGSGDILDAPQLQVSPAYDINDSQIRMRIKWGPGIRWALRRSAIPEGSSSGVKLTPASIAGNGADHLCLSLPTPFTTRRTTHITRAVECDRRAHLHSGTLRALGYSKG